MIDYKIIYIRGNENEKGCDKRRSDVIDDEDCRIDKAIARCKENAELYNKALAFFEEAKQCGVKYVADTIDVKPEEFIMEE